MNCPVCDGKLRQVQKHGVEVDICPDCKGVWLDRGELDKIVELVSSGGPAQVREEPVQPRQQEYRPEPKEDRERYREDRDRRYEEDRRYKERDDRNYDPRTGKRRKKESWFGEIFDMFGD